MLPASRDQYRGTHHTTQKRNSRLLARTHCLRSVKISGSGLVRAQGWDVLVQLANGSRSKETYQLTRNDHPIDPPIEDLERVRYSQVDFRGIKTMCDDDDVATHTPLALILSLSRCDVSPKSHRPRSFFSVQCFLAIVCILIPASPPPLQTAVKLIEPIISKLIDHEFQ